MNAIAQPLIYNAPIKVTENWFPERERSLATMTSTVSFPVGVLSGFVLPKLFIKPAYEYGSVLTNVEIDDYQE